MKQSRNQGFTTIELIIVVIVAAILIGVVGFAYKGVEARNRNQDRTVAINAIQKQLEAYYQIDGHYPSRRDLNDINWLNTSLRSLDTAMLQDPAGSTQQLAAQPQSKTYAYQPLDASGKTCEDNDQACVSYTLTATLEGGGQYSKQNIN